MTLRNFIKSTPLDDRTQKHSWREFNQLTYDYLENNKDKLMEMFNLDESYNPTDLKKEFVKWSKANAKPPVTENVHRRPWYFSEFMNERLFSN